MIKLDKKKSKKVCALLLTGALLFPATGCFSRSENQEINDRFSVSTIHGYGFNIMDNETGIRVGLSDEVIEKIKNGEEDIIISFNGNDIKLDESEIIEIKEVIKRIEDRNSLIILLVCSVTVYSFLGVTYSLFRFRKASAKIIEDVSDEESCEETQNEKKFIKKA